MCTHKNNVYVYIIYMCIYPRRLVAFLRLRVPPERASVHGNIRRPGIRQHFVRQMNDFDRVSCVLLACPLAYVSIRLHTSAYVNVCCTPASLVFFSPVRQHTSAYVSIRQRMPESRPARFCWGRQKRTSAYVSIRVEHTSAYVSIRQLLSPVRKQANSLMLG